MFKSIQAAAATAGQPLPDIDGAGIKRVFMVLHGFYGNLFLSKFATGSIDQETQEDQGMQGARRVWAHGLREYDAETVKAALRRCQERHPEFPPSLPQFVALCDAARPRAVWKPPVHAQPALEMSLELREQRRAEARAAATAAAQRELERRPVGLDLLKQSIARAVGEAGGDEAAELLRLDRLLTARVPA
jgi:hypothetical protein